MIAYLNERFLQSSRAQSLWAPDEASCRTGVFTTLRLYQGRPRDLQAHIQRLQKHAQALGMSLSMEQEQARQIIAQLVELNGFPDQDLRLRIALAPASPNADHQEIQGGLMMTPGPLPRDLPEHQSRGLAVVTLGPSFARKFKPHLKTLDTSASLAAQQQARRNQVQDAIILDEADQVLEGSYSNVLVFGPGGWKSPPDDGSILSGRTLELLTHLLKNDGIKINRESLNLEDLRQADEILLCNSVREILSVVQLDGHPVGEGRPGTLCLHLAQAYGELMGGKAALPAWKKPTT